MKKYILYGWLTWLILFAWNCANQSASTPTSGASAASGIAPTISYAGSNYLFVQYTQ